MLLAELVGERCIWQRPGRDDPTGDLGCDLAEFLDKGGDEPLTVRALVEIADAANRERGEFASRLDIQRAVLDAWYEFARHERRMRRPDE